LKKGGIKRLDFFLLALVLVVLGIRVFRIDSGKVIQAVTPSLTLVFTQWWQDELEENTLESLAEEFEKIHPGIKIKLDTRPYDEIRSLLLAGAEEPESPPWGDVIALDPLWLQDLIQKDVLEKLEDQDLPGGPGFSGARAELFPVNFTTGDEEGFDEGGFGEGFIDESSSGAGPEEKGEAWSLPLVSFINPLFYNIDLLKEAGFSRPPKTRSEFISMAAALTNASQGRFGAAFSLAGSRDLYQNVYPWIWASGAQLLPEGKPAITLRSVTETLDFFDQLHKQGSLALLENGQGLEDFILGKTALMVGSAKDINTLVKRMGKESFGITTVPVPDSYVGKPVFGISAWHGGISRSSPHRENARLFLSFLEKKSGFIAEKAHAIPGSGKVSGIEEDPLYSKAWDMYAGGDIIQEFAMVPRLAELETAFREELYLVFEENHSAPAAAEAIQKRWERALGRN
jgi:multiple sugar transport system substrate-binding protein